MKDVVLPFGAQAEVAADSLPSSEEILLRSVCVEDKAIAAAVTAADCERSGRSFLDVHGEIDGIRLVGFFRVELHILKIAGPLQCIAALGETTSGIQLLLRDLQ